MKKDKIKKTIDDIKEEAEIEKDRCKMCGQEVGVNKLCRYCGMCNECCMCGRQE